MQILLILLQEEEVRPIRLELQVRSFYTGKKDSKSAFFRDLAQMEELGAIRVDANSFGPREGSVRINLDWPQQIDENEFLRRIKEMPKGKSFKFLG